MLCATFLIHGDRTGWIPLLLLSVTCSLQQVMLIKVK